MRKSFSSDWRAQWKCDYKQGNVVHPREHMLGLWWIVCDTNPCTQPAEHGPGPGAEQERKRGEPFWCTEITGFAHNLAICYLLKFPPLSCQDKSRNIHRTRALQQRPGVFSPSGKFTASLGVFCSSWELWSGLSPNWSCWMSEVQSSFQKGAGWVIVLYIVKAEMQHNVRCKKSFSRHKIQVLGNDFQSWF